MTLAAYVAIGVRGGRHPRLRAAARPARTRSTAARSPSRWPWAASPRCCSRSRGDVSARHVADHQPAKLAAMEGQFHTERGAPLRLGGWPDEDARTTRYAIEIPYGLSRCSPSTTRRRR